MSMILQIIFTDVGKQWMKIRCVINSKQPTDTCGAVLETEKLVVHLYPILSSAIPEHAIRKFVRTLKKMPFIILSFIRWGRVFLQTTLFAHL